MKSLRVGIVGCGAISRVYLEQLGNGQWPQVRVVACADLDHSRAKASADKYGVTALGVDELIHSPEVDLVLNLTIPQAHFPIGMKAVRAGKHYYSEKPFTMSATEAKELLDEAMKHGVSTGCAPDTFLGSGIQTAIAAIDAGRVGSPVSVLGFMFTRGHERWHPSPEFYYKRGGGPLWDMGPYYLTAMVAMLGQVKEVFGVEDRTFDERTITSEPLRGQKIQVEVATHVTTLLRFASGATGALITSFDTEDPQLPNITVVGTEGTLIVPDPNTFGGVPLWRAGRETEEIAPVHEYSMNCRGIGVADMAAALQSGRPARARGQLAAHVTEIMDKVGKSAAEGTWQKVSAVERPAPFAGEL